jgi:hypothetical protein
VQLTRQAVVAIEQVLGCAEVLLLLIEVFDIDVRLQVLHHLLLIRQTALVRRVSTVLSCVLTPVGDSQDHVMITAM